ncbi:MAG: hypothetical protein V4726_12015 [Verrucomicrobiota bacterium]
MSAPPEPESAPSPRKPRWRRRLAWLFAVTLLLIGGLGVAGWLGRVSLVNRLLSSGNSVWKVHVDSISLEGGKVRVTGLVVRHVDRTEPVFQLASATTNASWSELRSARLGDVVLEEPSVFWRKGLRSDPQVPFTGLVPLVSWKSVKVTGGRLDLASGNHWTLTGQASGQAGAGAYLNDGRIDVGPASLRFDNPAFAIILSDAPVPGIAVKAEHLTLEGSLESRDGLLNLQDAAFTGTRLEVISRLAGAENPPQAAPADGTATGSGSGSGFGSSGPVRGVSITNLTAPGLRMQAASPWKITANTDLSARRFLWQSGQTSTAEGILLERSSLILAGVLRIPVFRLEGNLTPRGPQLSLLKLADAEILNLNQLLESLGLPPETRPSGTAKVDAELSGLDFFENRLISSAVQRLTLRDVSITLPEQGTVVISKAAAEGVPDEILTSRRLRRLAVENPVLTLSVPPGTASKPDIFLFKPPGLPAKTAGAPAQPGAAGPERPVWEGWTADSLTVNDGKLTVILPPPAVVNFSTGFSALTTAGEPGKGLTEPAAGPRWRLSLTNPSLALPAYPDQPVATAAELTLTADPATLWAKRELESFEIKGSTLSIGEALFQWVKSMPARPEPEAALAAGAPRPRPARPWRLKRLALDRSRVLLEDIGDGRRLEIPVSHQEFQDLPLDTAALASVDRLYKIEVPNITLYSPFGEGRKVAVLDTNYIQFTPSGLLANRLERVDLMLPSLYAGQPLFDFIAAARKRFTELADVPAGKPQPLLVTTARPDSGTLLSALASVQPAPDRPSNWHIPFYTESGKVFVAPKGFPWPNLPVIPFRNARDADGKPVPFLLEGETFHGELAVEPGWYEFPEYKLRLRISDRGRIVFNAPQRDRDNNLVEVFEHNTLIFRQLRIDDVWLAVTYDDKGIYAKFGGKTCGGTITGGFNLYLDELYTWDGWASFSHIQMKPLTDKLTPESFRMIGPLDELTVKACGDTASLYQATLDLKVTKAGRLEIMALDQMRESISRIGGMSADLGKIGVGTLRDFDYTGCRGSLRLFGTEGEGSLVLTGPAGSRTFQLNLRDYRGRVPRTTLPF